MTPHVSSTSLLQRIEAYYDAAPRPTATSEEVGPFTLFLPTSAVRWPYYARPRLGLDRPPTAAEVRRVRERQRELRVPEAFEWVHETTPDLLDAAREEGLVTHTCPLLVLGPGSSPSPPTAPGRGIRVAVLAADDTSLPDVVGVINAGFAGVDEVEPHDARTQSVLMARGLLSVVAAYDADGVVGGGSHSRRGDTTELTGIAVLPRARRRGVGGAITRALADDARRGGARTVFLSAQDEGVARVYERVGFRRVATACTAEPAPDH